MMFFFFLIISDHYLNVFEFPVFKKKYFLEDFVSFIVVRGHNANPITKNSSPKCNKSLFFLGSPGTTFSENHIE